MRDRLPGILAAHARWVAAGCSGPGRADLTGADLRGAVLRGTVLTDAVLTDADLTRAVLRGTVLTRADLTRVVLTDADLRGAVLTDAVLTDADLTDADLRGAVLTGAGRIPAIENIDAAILAAIEGGGSLEMKDWHTCGTTHCVAGWAITLAGEPGAALERAIGPAAAGALIFAKSNPDLRVPNFYASNEDALDQLRERAGRVRA